MAHWLVKTEPDAWSWSDQVRKGLQSWDGVRNAQAQIHMKTMRKGDQVFFYHTGGEKQIVGIVEVAREFHPDPTDESGKCGMVALKTVEPLPSPVTLAQVKADKRLANLALVRQSRLSVMPVDEKSWKILRRLGGLQ